MNDLAAAWVEAIWRASLQGPGLKFGHHPGAPVPF